MNTLVIIERVHTRFSEGVNSDEITLSPRWTYSKLLTVRERLLAQQIKKRQIVSQWSYSYLPCVELIRVPSHECACLANIGCDVWRTKHPLPKTLTSLDRHIIEYVMSIDNGKKIDESSRTAMLYLKGNKYTSEKSRYVIENGHIYFPVKDSPGLVKIKLLAEDPIEAMKYPSFCPCTENCTDCKPYADVEFPIDGDLIEVLIEMTVAEMMGGVKPRQQEQQQQE